MLKKSRKFGGRTYILKDEYPTKTRAKQVAEKLRERGYYSRRTGKKVWVSQFPKFYYM